MKDLLCRRDGAVIFIWDYHVACCYIYGLTASFILHTKPFTHAKQKSVLTLQITQGISIIHTFTHFFFQVYFFLLILPSLCHCCCFLFFSFAGSALYSSFSSTGTRWKFIYLEFFRLLIIIWYCVCGINSLSYEPMIWKCWQFYSNL